MIPTKIVPKCLEIMGLSSDVIPPTRQRLSLHTEWMKAQPGSEHDVGTIHRAGVGRHVADHDPAAGEVDTAGADHDDRLGVGGRGVRDESEGERQSAPLP